MISFVSAVLITIVKALLRLAIVPVPVQPGSTSCSRDIASAYVNLILAGGFAFVGLPFSYYMTRGATDAYHLTSSIKATFLTAVPVYIWYVLVVFISSALAGPLNHNDIVSIGLVLVQFWVAVFPLVWDSKIAYDARTKVFNRSDFVDVLANDAKYEKLREAAMDEFSTENPLFCESFQNYLARSLLLLSGYTDSKIREEMISKLTGGMFRDSAHLKQDLVRNTRILTKFLSNPIPVTDVPVDVPMTYGVASALTKIYNRFLAAGAPLELNVPDTLKQEVIPYLKKLDSKLKQPAEQEGQKRNNSDVVPGFFLNFGPAKCKLSPNDVVVQFDILDKIKATVLDVMYTNTFPRYIRRQAEAKV